MQHTVSLPPPSLWRRFACMLYEGVLLFGVVFLADYLFDTLTQSTHALMWRNTRQAWLFVAIGLYFMVSWRQGQTLPMKTWNMRLVDAQGGRLPLGTCAARYTLAWVLPLLSCAMVWALVRVSGWPAFYLFTVFAPMSIFVPAWFDPKGRFMHDRVLGTQLVSVASKSKTAGA